jgi:hypothetical protein
MRDIQFSSRSTDRRVLAISLPLVFSALAGFAIRPPILASEYLRLLYATVCLMLAAVVLRAFRTFGYHRGSIKQSLLMGWVFVLAWAALAAVAMVGIRRDPGLRPVKSQFEDPNGNFELFVSNQSFAVNSVDIRVAIDGVPVIQKYFDVGNQHGWEGFRFRLAPGSHRLVARSLKGKASIEQTFEVQTNQNAILNYWYYPWDYNHFSFEVRNGQRIGFM